MSAHFQFKQFSVIQDKCAMKVGTDGVLLGAWISPNEEPQKILDVGTGSGVISLMLAQRFPNSQIEALEIDGDAYEQAVSNFENAPWADRLFCYHASFQEYFQEVDDEKYDLIISNPPFYLSTQKTEDSQRNQARFDDSLPFEHLFYGASKLLAEEGIFTLIIPFEREKEALEIATQMHLKPAKITRVKGTESAPVKRSLLQFQFNTRGTDISDLILEKERHVYTEEYQQLVKEFYLKL